MPSPYDALVSDQGPLGNPFEGLPIFGDSARMLGQQGGSAWESARQLAVSALFEVDILEIRPDRSGREVGFSSQSGSSAYARLIDAHTERVLWARRVGGPGVPVDSAVRRVIAAVPSR